MKDLFINALLSKTDLSVTSVLTLLMCTSLNSIWAIRFNEDTEMLRVFTADLFNLNAQENIVRVFINNLILIMQFIQ